MKYIGVASAFMASTIILIAASAPPPAASQTQPVPSVVALADHDQLTQLAPKLVIAQPSERDGGEWVLDFGSQTVPGTYSQPIVIDNLGTLQGTVKTASLRAGSDPSFVLTPPSLPEVIAPSKSSQLTVTFSPMTPGPRVGFVGRVEAVKGIDVLLDAFQLMSSQASLIVAGDGSERARLLPRLQSDRVHLRPPLRDA